MDKKVKVRYAVSLPEKDDFIENVYLEFELSSKQVIRYGASFGKIARLRKIDNLLLLFLTEEMDDFNLVNYSVSLRSVFRNYLISVSEGEQDISDRTVMNSFEVLKKENLVIGSGTRKDYYINPVYFAKDSVKRKYIVKLLAEAGKIKV